MTAYLAATTDQDLPALAQAAGAERFEFAADPASEDGTSGWLVFPDLDQATLTARLGLDADQHAAGVAQARAVVQERVDRLAQDLDAADEGDMWIRAVAADNESKIAPARQLLRDALAAMAASGATPVELQDAQKLVEWRTKDLEIVTEASQLSSAAVAAYQAEVLAPAQARLDAARAELAGLDADS